MRHVHRDEPALYHRGGPPGVVAEPKLPCQHRMTQVEALTVGQDGHRVDVEPVTAVDAERQCQPVRQVDQTFVVDRGARDVVREPVVHPGRVGARIVDRPGPALRCRAAGGEVAVADRAQRLAELLVVRFISFVAEGPGLHRHIPLVGEPIRAAPDEIAHLLRTFQRELRGRSTVAVLGVPNDDPDAVEPQRIECVFVGQVVADVHRQQGTLAVDLIADPGQRRALVPVDVGPKLDNLAPVSDPQLFALPDAVRACDYLTDVLRRHFAIVHRDGETLVLQPNPRNVRQRLGQLGGGAFQPRHRCGARVVLVVLAVRPDQLEAMATGVPDAGNTHALADVGKVAAAEDRDRALLRQLLQRLGCTANQPRRGRIGHDRGQRSIVVECDHRAPGADDADHLTIGLQRVRDGGHAFVAGAHVDLGEVVDHDVGSTLQEVDAVPGPVDADHQREPATAAGRHAGLGVRDDDGALRARTNTARGILNRRAGFSRQPQFVGDDLVDADGEQVGDPGGLQHPIAVVTGRVDRGTDAGGLQFAYQGDSRFEHGHAVGRQL